MLYYALLTHTFSVLVPVVAAEGLQLILHQYLIKINYLKSKLKFFNKYDLFYINSDCYFQIRTFFDLLWYSFNVLMSSKVWQGIKGLGMPYSYNDAHLSHGL